MGMEDDAKVAYLKAFTRLANADGKFDDSEKAFIRNLAERYVIPTDRLPEIFAASNDEKIVEDVKQIQNRRAALELIKELCFLAHADDELTDDEILFIGRVGQAMHVELEKIEEISSWVIDKIILAERSKIIFEEV